MSEAPKKTRTFLYSLVRTIAKVAFHTVAPVHYVYGERLERTGPMILIANHQSWCDPALMAVPIRREQVVFMGKKELAANVFLKKILTDMHCILVDRHHRDMEAMRSSMRALKEGRILGIFPEGTRHHEGQMEQIEGGTALLALRSHAPLLPVYIDRPFRFFRKTTVYTGEEIPYEDLLSMGINTETCDLLNERIRECYRKMILAAK